MKMIISKEDKVKRLVLLWHNALPRRGRPEEFTEMNPSNTGHGRQNPSVNSKKKPDLEDKEEDDEEEEEEEEEEEIATAVDSKEVSHVHVDTDACDHSK